MKHWLMLAGVALVGSLVGFAAKVVINNHTAAATPPTSQSNSGSVA